MAGLFSIILLARIAVKLGQSSPYGVQPVHRGVGTIVSRGDFTPGAGSAAGAGAVTIEVVLKDGRRATARWTIPEPYWSALEVGSRVAVLYQVAREDGDIRIVESGVVALDSDIR